jgi:hypothetical protein
MHRTACSILLVSLLCFASTALAEPRAKIRPRATQPSLQLVQHKGQAYYKTYRVTSSSGLCRIKNTNDPFRFFKGGGQYGEAFYLFHKLGDARRFASCEKARGASHRNVIAEVLLPKKAFDQVKKAEVKKPLDWAMNRGRGDQTRSKLTDLRLANHILFGKWAESPGVKEPFYTPMNGIKQIGVVQLGMPSILNKALIREIEQAK